MPDVPQRPPERKDPDPSFAHARKCLAAFIAAGDALAEAWHPKLDLETYPGYLPSFDQHVATLSYWYDEVFEVGTVEEDENVKPLDLSNATQVRAWLTDLQVQIDDAVAAGEDATRPLSRRMLGRTKARKKVLEARQSLRSLVVAAQRGLAKAPPT